MASAGNNKQLQGVLKWTVEQQRDQKSDSAGPAREMSKEDRDFLKSALADLQSAPSDVDLIKNCLGVVHRVVETVGEASSASDIDEAVEKGEEALEALTDLCEGIDNANDMIPLGGFPVVKNALQVNRSSLQCTALQLFGTLCQNNPKCQQHALTSDLLPLFLQLLNDSDHAGVRTKALFATSCLVKDFDPAQAAFAAAHGYDALRRCLSSGIEKVVIKASFLVSNLVTHCPANGDLVLSSGILDQLLDLLSSERVVSLEYVASAASCLVEQHAGCLSKCHQRSSVLLPPIQQHITVLKGGDDLSDVQDEIHHLEHFISKLS